MTDIRNIRLNFTGSQGHRLDARLDLPPRAPRAYAVFAHCFTCTKESLAAYRISHRLAKHGYAVLRFDFTGLGHSQGNFADTNFSTSVADLLCAVDFLRHHHEAPKLLLGHSLGGTAAIMAAKETPEVVAVTTVASPSKPSHVLHHFGHALDDLEKGQPAEITVAGKQYPINPQFIRDVRQYKSSDIVSDLNKPLLAFHGPEDKLVGFEHAQKLSKYASQPISVVSLDKADHVLSQREDADYVADIINAWIQRYL